MAMELSVVVENAHRLLGSEINIEGRFIVGGDGNRVTATLTSGAAAPGNRVKVNVDIDPYYEQIAQHLPLGCGGIYVIDDMSSLLGTLTLDSVEYGSLCLTGLRSVEVREDLSGRTVSHFVRIGAGSNRLRGTRSLDPGFFGANETTAEAAKVHGRLIVESEVCSFLPFGEPDRPSGIVCRLDCAHLPLYVRREVPADHQANWPRLEVPAVIEGVFHRSTDAPSRVEVAPLTVVTIVSGVALHRIWLDPSAFRWTYVELSG